VADNESFLSRWARRKQETARRSAEPERLPQSAPVGEAAKASPEGRLPEPVPPGRESGQPAESFDPASLPALDTIDGASDITAFLARGVPAELTKAALRRAWAADPAIRDFVGLSENAWDFTAPDGVPGFGPLRASDDVRQLLAQVGRLEPEPGAQSGAAAVPSAGGRPTVLESQADSTTAQTAGGNPPQQAHEVVNNADDAAGIESVPSTGQGGEIASRMNGVAGQNAPEAPQSVRPARARPHGRALPK
jgi:hypothetical protein